jgi:hypothetical protein
MSIQPNNQSYILKKSTFCDKARLPAALLAISGWESTYSLLPPSSQCSALNSSSLCPYGVDLVGSCCSLMSGPLVKYTGRLRDAAQTFLLLV